MTKASTTKMKSEADTAERGSASKTSGNAGM